ncbi:MAG: hypothetical protein M1825_005735 [Sarcosagium campestre]|nr:MAG: hypothetical protein M1825_005735 [Sarcosagium campestre]
MPTGQADTSPSPASSQWTRPSYTPKQLSKYFSHISFPTPPLPLSRAQTHSAHEALPFLTSLQHHQISRIPFESLSLHYSPTHSLSLEPDELFEKIVVRGHGGYCMELNRFYATVLHSLGFDVYTAGGRISHAVTGQGARDGFGGWSHMVIILQLDSPDEKPGLQRYIIDVGFGANGQTHPLPLLSEAETASTEPQTQWSTSYRLIWRHIPQLTDPNQRVWIYEYRRGGVVVVVDGGEEDKEGKEEEEEESDSLKTRQGEWEPAYCFTELEFLPGDYGVMNFSTSSALAGSWFTTAVVCVRFILEDDVVTGKAVVWRDRFTLTKRGVVEEAVVMRSEAQRVELLEKWFGVVLTPDERGAIRGMVSEITESTD